ncbi:DNA polymerase delta subunit 2 [Galdieria sulphuraria]|uniref:DNA polymerase delta subunit 2 n=1 Tax=Galdieria sulphuraria TaxID=130081 RepID=M2X386_GALSU|nr:DNA polymerase delta subunit 2 [Galdieria sulphuraria]EME30835.1 DNA polymerase delta subunit 2 [Galdieria sulphuraria]GJD08224.1 DNA polymerase delta subunit 2 [Galdieria sulphuraria]|eukprot:XP_005707355.1 DNA polymerase delta subunit 2 [Galdieria sulphuraria]
MNASHSTTTVMYRQTVDYEEEHNPFLLHSRNYSQQYSQIYFCRLAALRPVVENAARNKWTDGILFRDRLLHLQQGDNCVIIGVIYKEMDLKPSILKEYSKNPAEPVPILPVKPSFVSDSDVVILEDETGRIRLNFDRCCLGVNILLTGTVVAVKGQETSSGDFSVDELCFPGIPPLKVPRSLDNDIFILFVSGIGLGAPWNVSMREAMFLDFITGKLGNEEDYHFCSQIGHLFVLGNLLSSAGDETLANKSNDQQTVNSAQQLFNAEPLISADRFLTTLSSTIPVTLLPGEADPTNLLLPQQPLHHSLLPSSSKYNSFRRVTNPYQCCINGRKILVCSGQNIDDACRYSTWDWNSVENRLTVMENMLSFRHLCPTAPDTLPCYPYYDEDPFVLKECPHVYVAGNQHAYGTRLINANDCGVRLLCIPDFSTTGQVVLLNLRTLTPQVMEFMIDLN